MLEVPDYLKCVHSDMKSADAMPGEKELNYQGFVVALVKVANIAKSKFRNETEEEQEQSKEFQEY